MKKTTQKFTVVAILACIGVSCIRLFPPGELKIANALNKKSHNKTHYATQDIKHLSCEQNWIGIADCAFEIEAVTHEDTFIRSWFGGWKAVI